MSSALPKSESMLWLQVSDRALTLIVRSTVEWWQAHWDPTVRRTRRCEGGTCRWCMDGLSRSTRFVIAVEPTLGDVCLLELRERHRIELEILHQRPRMGVGSLIRVQKEGPNANAPLTVTILHQVQAVPIDIARLVGSLGLRV